MSKDKQPQIRFNPYKILGAIYHLPNFLKLLYRLFNDREVPFTPKLVLLAALAYFISPFDLLPDFLIPVLGYLEDIIILIMALKVFVKYSPEEVVWKHVKAIEQERASRPL